MALFCSSTLQFSGNSCRTNELQSLVDMAMENAKVNSDQVLCHFQFEPRDLKMLFKSE